MVVKILSFFLLLSLIAGNVNAQKYMVVSNARKQIYYKSGEIIRYKLKTEDHFRKSAIISVTDTAMKIKNYIIGYDEIDKIDIRGKSTGTFNWSRLGGYMQIAGIAYIAIDQFNKTVVQGNPWEFESDVWITGAIIFAGGTILRIIDPRKVKIGTKYKIKYLIIPTAGQNR